MIINDRERYETVKSTISMKNIRKLLDNKDYTVVKLATNCGVSVSAINGYISGDRCPSVANLISMADYLNCNTDFLLGRTNNPEDIDTYSSSNPKVDEIMHILRKLPEHQVELTAAYVKGLVDSRKD